MACGCLAIGWGHLVWDHSVVGVMKVYRRGKNEMKKNSAFFIGPWAGDTTTSTGEKSATQPCGILTKRLWSPRSLSSEFVTTLGVFNSLALKEFEIQRGLPGARK